MFKISEISEKTIEDIERGMIDDFEYIHKLLYYYDFPVSEMVVYLGNKNKYDGVSEYISQIRGRLNISDKKVGRIFESIRIHYQKSREEVASMVNISTGYLYEIEKGKRVPSQRVINNIIYVLWNMGSLNQKTLIIENKNISAVIDDYYKTVKKASLIYGRG